MHAVLPEGAQDPTSSSARGKAEAGTRYRARKMGYDGVEMGTLWGGDEKTTVGSLGVQSFPINTARSIVHKILHK
jgi:hypothetical protein